MSFFFFYPYIESQWGPMWCSSKYHLLCPTEGVSFKCLFIIIQEATVNMQIFKLTLTLKKPKASLNQLRKIY